jgi:hypothetical protein
MNQFIQPTHLASDTFVLRTNFVTFVTIPFCLLHLSLLAILLTPRFLTPKISYLIRLFLSPQSSPSSSTTASTTLPLHPVIYPTSPSPLPLLSGQNSLSTPPSLFLPLLPPYPANPLGTDTALLPLPAGTDSVRCLLLSPTLCIYPVIPNNQNTLYMPQT